MESFKLEHFMLKTFLQEINNKIQIITFNLDFLAISLLIQTGDCLLFHLEGIRILSIAGCSELISRMLLTVPESHAPFHCKESECL